MLTRTVRCRAIRGWNNAAGASRIKALFEAVPKGQWIPLDMDIKGIWRYFGNYSFYGAPFIWTTLHNMVSSADARLVLLLLLCQG